MDAVPAGLEEYPFISKSDLFVCPEHHHYAKDTLLEATSRVNYVYSRDWLRLPTLEPAFQPQIGDYVVYFPQGHLQHLLEFGDKDLPFTNYPCCVCKVISQEFCFPHHLCVSMSIILRLQLQVVAIPHPDSQKKEKGQPIQSFVTLPSSDFPSFYVNLRDCSLPEYLVCLSNLFTI